MIPTQGKLRKKIGELRSSENKINFGDVVHKQILTHKIEVENPTNSTVTMSVADCPGHIKLEFEPETLKQGDKGEILITFNSKSINTYGSLKDTLQINLQIGSIRNKRNIYVTANLVEDFSILSAKEIEDAPVIYFPKKFVNLGQLEAKKEKDVIIEFENLGKSDLFIRKIEIHNNSFKIAEYDKIVKSGNKGKLIIRINPEFVYRNLNTQVIVIANDPKNSKTILKIYGSIKVQEPHFDKKNKSHIRVTNVNVNTTNNLLKKYKNSDDLVVLDVRTPQEYQKGCIPGALNFDVENNNFENMIRLLDRNKKYLIYCKSGIRSEKAIKIMEKLGYKNIFHMLDGMDGWKDYRLKVSKPDQ